MVKINIPKEISYILDTLEKNNYEAYIVGGCVRDSVLNRQPKDWDVTTNALPEDIIRIFNHTVPTGIKHGTVTVIVEDQNIEITTYRIDGEYSDNRHPDEVIFTSSLEEDLSRRDFTINSMAYNSKIGLVDPFKGEQDLANNLIKAVGNPDTRFNEDALRELRAIRFAAQLNFSIDNNTYASIISNSGLIKNISPERIKDELCKILLSDNPGNGIRDLKDTKLLSYILPELNSCVDFDQKNPHHDKDVFEHILSVLDNSPKDIIIRISALLHDVGKPKCFTIDKKVIGHFYGHNIESAYLAEKILQRLKFDNYTIKTVTTLVKEHMCHFEKIRPYTVKKIINRTGPENLDKLFELIIADIKAHKAPFNFDNVNNLRSMCYEILSENQPLTLKDLKITGNDLIDLGFKKGIEIGNVLNEILDMVLKNPELNTKEQLSEIALRNKLHHI